ncbi:VOC family protein [Salana multivorans]
MSNETPPPPASTPATPYTVQVAVDAADPHTLADWWAEALGWVVEPQDEAFIRSMVAKGYASNDDTLLHNGALVWRIGAAIRHPDGLGVAPRILFQAVPESKTVKNRVHLDLRAAGEPATPPDPAELERILAMGATEISRGQQGPLHWAVLTDPEGNEFCLTVPAS